MLSNLSMDRSNLSKPYSVRVILSAFCSRSIGTRDLELCQEGCCDRDLEEVIRPTEFVGRFFELDCGTVDTTILRFKTFPDAFFGTIWATEDCLEFIDQVSPTIDFWIGIPGFGMAIMGVDGVGSYLNRPLLHIEYCIALWYGYSV